MRDRFSGEAGAAAVEFALVLPILVLLVMGIIEFSRAYNAKISLQHAVREGVRVHALQTGDDPVQRTKDAATSLDGSQIDVTVTACAPGSPTSVAATYPFSYDIPMFGSSSITLSASGVMRCGG